MKTVLFLLGCVASFSSIASSLEISKAWIRSLPPSIPVRSGYLNIKNNTDRPINIVGIESEVFTQVEIHETVEKNGMMTMRPVLPLQIPADTVIELSPGGLHLMMRNPLRELKPEDRVEIILHFDSGESQIINMTLRQ